MVPNVIQEFVEKVGLEAVVHRYSIFSNSPTVLCGIYDDVTCRFSLIRAEAPVSGDDYYNIVFRFDSMELMVNVDPHEACFRSDLVGEASPARLKQIRDAARECGIALIKVKKQRVIKHDE